MNTVLTIKEFENYVIEQELTELEAHHLMKSQLRGISLEDWEREEWDKYESKLYKLYNRKDLISESVRDIFRSHLSSPFIALIKGGAKVIDGDKYSITYTMPKCNVDSILKEKFSQPILNHMNNNKGYYDLEDITIEEVSDAISWFSIKWHIYNGPEIYDIGSDVLIKVQIKGTKPNGNIILDLKPSDVI